MLEDRYNRKIDYLRISVTDRCNLRCIYCMPEYGILQKDPQEILTFEEITKVVQLSISAGINKVRITGGEPLVRRNLPRLLRLLFSVPGLEDLSLTTNGILLKKYVQELKTVGLKKMNISLDTLDGQKFKLITRLGRLEDVLEGIDLALAEGFFIKLNVVILKGLNDGEILSFAKFAEERKVILRFIELMPTVDNRIADGDLYISCAQIQSRLSTLGRLKALSLKFGNGPARYYKIEGRSLIVGFISPMSSKFCFNCNRLRLTADGLLIPCLGNPAGFDLKGLLRQNQNREEGVLRLIKKAVLLKPEGHNFSVSSLKQCLMSQIGG